MIDTRTIDDQFHEIVLTLRGERVLAVEWHGDIYLKGGAQHARRRETLLASLIEAVK